MEKEAEEQTRDCQNVLLVKYVFSKGKVHEEHSDWDGKEVKTEIEGLFREKCEME